MSTGTAAAIILGLLAPFAFEFAYRRGYRNGLRDGKKAIREAAWWAIPDEERVKMVHGEIPKPSWLQDE